MRSPDQVCAGASRFADARGLRTHYFDWTGGDPPIVLLHGLSANACEFGGIVRAGLVPAHRVIAPDLRGRGRTATPRDGYGMAEHARDVLALMDLLALDRVILGGHSFGGFLAIYLAAHHPGRFERLVVLDVAITLQPYVRDLLRPSLERLTRVSASAAEYLAEVRGASYMGGVWDEATEAYFRAEMDEHPDGTVRSTTSAYAVQRTLQSVGAERWDELVRMVRVPALLFHAPGPYGEAGAPPLIDADSARATAAAFTECQYIPVPGNHLTMVFGAGARVIARGIHAFARGEDPI